MSSMDEPSSMDDIPITSLDAHGSLSLADVNLMEKGTPSNRSLSSPEKEQEGEPTESMLEHTDSSADLPNVEEVRANMKEAEQAPRRKRRWCLYLCIPCCVIIVVFVLSLVLAVAIEEDDEYNREHAQGNQNHRPTDSAPSGPSYVPPTDSGSAPVPAPPAPPAFKKPSVDEIMQWVADQGISTKNDLQATDSPQNRAAKWLAEEDTLTKALPTKVDDEAYMYMTRYVMAVVYYSMNGEEWLTSLNFLSSAEVCGWNGLSHTSVATFEQGGLVCDDTTGKPIKLDIEFNNLAGEIPSEIGMLDTLEVIDLSANDNIVGEVPTEICNIPGLKILNLKLNQISGEIPTCITSMKALEELNFLATDLSGYIPDAPELCDLTNMRKLVLDKNFLEGEIPDCVYKWPNLEVLSVSDNKLSGTISTQLGKLTKLKKLYLDGNQFNGEIIPSLNKLTELVLMYIENNQFEGKIDEDFVKDLSALRALDISSNKFTSEEYGIPTHLFKLSSLEVLDLSQNALQGKIPAAVPRNHHLKYLSVHENQMNGGIPSQLTNLTGLLHLDLSNNTFHGPLRQEIFELRSVRHIFLAENPDLHSGPIPDSLADLTQLTELSMKNTNRTGPLPEMLGFNNLFLLDLDNNKFTGQIPSNYGQLPTLRHLLLNRNDLTGDVPVFEKHNLGTVLLDGTGVTGDLNSICELEGFKGGNAQKYGSIVVADCGGDQTDITCDCCHCCDPDAQPYCSDPLVVSLDWTWEFGWTRLVRDFNLNYTILENPQSLQDSPLNRL